MRKKLEGFRLKHLVCKTYVLQQHVMLIPYVDGEVGDRENLEVHGEAEQNRQAELDLHTLTVHGAVNGLLWNQWNSEVDLMRFSPRITAVTVTCRCNCCCPVPAATCHIMPHLFGLPWRVIMNVNLTTELTQCPLHNVGLGLNKDVVPCCECWKRHWIWQVTVTAAWYMQTTALLFVNNTVSYKHIVQFDSCSERQISSTYPCARGSKRSSFAGRSGLQD